MYVLIGNKDHFKGLHDCLRGKTISEINFKRTKCMVIKVNFHCQALEMRSQQIYTLKPHCRCGSLELSLA